MKKGDKFVLVLSIIIFLSSILSVAFYFLTFNSNQIEAEIYVNGKCFKEINLCKVRSPQEIKIGTDDYNLILVRKGRIRFEKSNCKDETCVKTGWLSKPGSMAACIPHKVYIKLVNSQDEDLDAKVY